MDGVTNTSGMTASEATALSLTKIQQQVVSTLLQSTLASQQKQILDLISLALKQNGIGNAVDVFA